MKIVIVANTTCSLSSQGCILSSSEINNKTLSMDNLRASPPVLQFPPISQNQTQYLYVSDTENHCIKKLDLLLQTSTVVAGLCGQKGFLDGPIGFNKLNRPTNLGVTRTGDVYFYDLGNQYMRKLTNTGEVITLLNGACKFCILFVIQLETVDRPQGTGLRTYYAMIIGWSLRQKLPLSTLSIPQI